MNKEIFTNSILQTHIVRIIWQIVDENEMNDERGGKKLLSDSQISGILKVLERS